MPSCELPAAPSLHAISQAWSLSCPLARGPPGSGVRGIYQASQARELQPEPRPRQDRRRSRPGSSLLPARPRRRSRSLSTRSPPRSRTALSSWPSPREGSPGRSARCAGLGWAGPGCSGAARVGGRGMVGGTAASGSRRAGRALTARRPCRRTAVCQCARKHSGSHHSSGRLDHRSADHRGGGRLGRNGGQKKPHPLVDLVLVRHCGLRRHRPHVLAGAHPPHEGGASSQPKRAPGELFARGAD